MAARKVIPGQPFQTLLRYNKPYWRSYAAGSIISLGLIGAGLSTPWLIRAIVGRLESGTLTHGMLFFLCAAILVAAVVTGIARYFQRRIMIGASRKFEYDLRNDFFAHIQVLSQRFFHRTKTGDIMARGTSDISFVRELIGPGVMNSVNMIRVPITLSMMVYLSPRLTLLSMIPLPIISVMVYALLAYMHRQSKVVQEILARVTAQVQENLAGAKVVKAYGIADRQLAQFESVSREYMGANVRLVAITSLIWPLIGVLVGTITLTVIWQGGQMVIAKTLSMADFSAFIFFMIMLAWPLAQFGWVLTLYQRGKVSMNRLSSILSERPDIEDGEDTRPEAAIREGGLRFENVSFAYNEIAVLHDISFEVSSGETLAIVGATGCGKTSLVSLLTREYEATSGSIYIDDFEIRSIPIRVLRSAIGCVPQDTFIFSDSILNNLCAEDGETAVERIEEACATAQFLSVIETLPAGIDTLLGERGVNLSGGQKQRLTLARSLLRDAKILILDDALSGVDTQTEERILEGLRGRLSGQTRVIISHRISTVRDADLILVLNEGRLVERGTHEVLLAEEGMYAQMYARQLLEQELEEQ